MIRSLIRRAVFDPGFVGLFTNPFYFARKGLIAHIRHLAPRVSGRILDVGCGRKPYRALFEASEYVGLELDTAENRALGAADHFYDGTKFPFSDQEFDAILAHEVFEHVFNPDEFLGELFRVLKDGGLLLLTVPFAWDEHSQPIDFARYSSFGLRHLLESHGFEVVVHEKSMADVRAVVQMFTAYLQKVMATGNKYVNFASTLTFIAPFNILGECLGAVLPSNPDFYLDNIVLARKRPA